MNFQNFSYAKSVNFLGSNADKIKLPIGKIALPIGNYAYIILYKYLNVCAIYIIIIASPKLKKRYSSSTAVLYASSMRSRPAKADTSISKVLSGR